MLRPLESAFALQRVRLTSKIPLLEAEKLVQMYLESRRHRRLLVKHSTIVTEGSYCELSKDERSLSQLLEIILSDEYQISPHSQELVSMLVDNINEDGLTYKRFERTVEPLFSESSDLERLSRLTERVVDSNKEFSHDLRKAMNMRWLRPIKLT